MVQVLRTARPTARKTHRCDLCGGPINPGETYSRQTNIYDARVYDWLTCPACAPVMTAVWAWLGSPWDEDGTDDRLAWAAHVADELARAGLLADPTTRTEWGAVICGEVCRHDTEQAARDCARTLGQGQIVRRTVTDWTPAEEPSDD